MIVRFPQGAGLTIPLYLLLHTFGPPASAQFKEIGPPPFSPAVAHQRIRTLLDQVDPVNRQQTINKLISLVPWFRNVLDEELIAGWQTDSRGRLLLLVEPLADAGVAVAVVGYSWRTRSEATLNPSYASMLAHLMARYPESGTAFLSDLLGPMPPELSPPQIETVCRILLDMPDIGTWNESALKILPRYRATAERLLMQDREGNDQEKSYRAQIWLAQLRGETPGAISPPSIARKRAISQTLDHNDGPILRPQSAAAPSRPTADQRPEDTAGNRPAQPSPSVASVSAPAQPQPSANVNMPSVTNSSPVQPPTAASAPAASVRYDGPVSGALECNGGPVPQNAEYVFRNLPPLKMQLDYDKSIWEARLAPGENQSQRLILKNKSSGPQKRCVVRWKILP